MEDRRIYIFTDGSGSSAPNSCGGAAIVYDAETDATYQVGAGLSFGTSNAGELLAVYIALKFCAQYKTRKNREIWIFTDSELICKQGRGEYKIKYHKDLWAAIENLVLDNSLYLRWVHIERDLVQANKSAHNLANRMRKGADLSDEEPKTITLREIEVSLIEGK